MIALEQLKRQNCVEKLKTNITLSTIPLERHEDLFEFLYDQIIHIMPVCEVHCIYDYLYAWYWYRYEIHHCFHGLATGRTCCFHFILVLLLFINHSSSECLWHSGFQSIHAVPVIHMYISTIAGIYTDGTSSIYYQVAGNHDYCWLLGW